MEPMSTQACGLIQDQNLSSQCKGASVGGKINATKAQKKVGPGGRKALTDVTNSGKPSSHHGIEKSHSKKFNVIGEKTHISKPSFSVGGKTNVSKNQEKIGLVGRKALADVTNSGKLCQDTASKKNNSMKLDAIAEEQCLHNHQECIKSQRRARDAQFLLTLGLDDEFATPGIPPVSRHAKARSPPKYLEFEEIHEEVLLEDRSPPQVRTPESPISSPYWIGYPSPNLVLKGTPKSLKY